MSFALSPFFSYFDTMALPNPLFTFCGVKSFYISFQLLHVLHCVHVVRSLAPDSFVHLLPAQTELLLLLTHYNQPHLCEAVIEETDAMVAAMRETMATASSSSTASKTNSLHITLYQLAKVESLINCNRVSWCLTYLVEWKGKGSSSWQGEFELLR